MAGGAGAGAAAFGLDARDAGAQRRLHDRRADLGVCGARRSGRVDEGDFRHSQALSLVRRVARPCPANLHKGRGSGGKESNWVKPAASGAGCGRSGAQFCDRGAGFLDRRVEPFQGRRGLAGALAEGFVLFFHS